MIRKTIATLLIAAASSQAGAATDGFGLSQHETRAPLLLAQVSTLYGKEEAWPIEIDIKPGSDPVCKGVIPIAILGSDTLDVMQIDQATLSFEGEGVRVGKNGVLSCKIKDANKDGYYDLVCQYDDSTTEGTLNGELLDGTTSIEGANTFCLGN